MSEQSANGTDSQNTDQDPQDFDFPPITTTVNWFDRPDPVLQDLVGIANIGSGVPVTLYVPWGVVSGHVHAPHEFFAAAAEANRSGARESGDEGAIALSDAIAGRAFDRWSEPVEESDRMKVNLQHLYDTTTFLHLTHVKAWLSGSNGPIEHDHLRIRMSAVSAWTHGMIR